MTRRPAFWVFLGVLGVAGFFAALRLFPLAFPLISLDITMDRDAALSGSAILSERYGWDRPETRVAASFGQIDPQVQTYVELEGGGREAFVELADQNTYHPYGWTVRRYAEGEIRESRIRFTPAGDAYGFVLTLPEDEPGEGNVSAELARTMAETTAAEWDVDLAPFDLLDASSETHPGGRVDHTLVYQRRDVSVGEARFRVRIVIAGQESSELTHFVFIPEAFEQRYIDMRSSNDAIALAAQSVLFLIFILGACVGTAMLMRQRWVEWRAPLVWGAVVAGLLALNTINALPLSWMSYDTAVSTDLFLLGQIALAVLIFVLVTPLLAFFFMAAESFGRRAFPEHLQQWRFWSQEVAASRAALGRTLAAYLLLGFGLGYVVLFYLGTSSLDGWWSPAEALVQPDLLATYQPWLMAVSTSLFAAFWEESIFRAVPIAGAALIGARFGRRGAWIWGAIAIQAVVFAAGHANYPQQPAYARVIELVGPAFLWGVVYLHFGLVPTILTHFLYDLSLFGLPLFASDAPGGLVDRGLLIAFGLVPMFVVLRARRGGRATAEAPSWAYNREWSPPTGSHPPDDSREPTAPVAVMASVGLPVRRSVLYGLGLAGAVLWLGTTLGGPDEAPPFTESRSEAIAAGRAALEASFGPKPSFVALTSVPQGRGPDHRYVFEEAGEEPYADLVGTFLGAPRWVVRFVDFGAEAEERVEEYLVHVGPEGEIVRFEHVLPEGRAGERLEENPARTLALEVVRDRFGQGEASVREVGAEKTTLPTRTDWEFTFSDPSVLGDVAGEGRIRVSIAGDEVIDAHRFVHVPEEWERGQKAEAMPRTIVNGGAGLLLFLGYGAATVLAVVLWAKRKLTIRPVLQIGAIVLVAMAVSQLNAWPALSSNFVTQLPWGLQVGAAMVGLVLITVVGAAAIGLATALAHAGLGERQPETESPLVALAVGMTLVGVASAGSLLGTGLPDWPDLSNAATFLPTVAGATGSVLPYLFLTSVLMVLSAQVIRSRHQRWWSSALIMMVLSIGLLMTPDSLQDSFLTWIPAGLVIGTLVFGVAHLGASVPALIPGVMATILGIELVQVILAPPHHGARLGALLGLIVLGSIAWWWTRVLDRSEATANAEGGNP